TRLGQGRENAKAFLRENPELTLQLENLIRAQASLPPKGAPVKAIATDVLAVEGENETEEMPEEAPLPPFPEKPPPFLEEEF
ncbi:MAG: hypothetical protein ACUVV0_16205, partial [Anaerolineae bacterium]